MAHTLSNESLKRAEEYKKQRIMSGTPEVRAANIASTKRAGVEAARRANTPAVKKTQEASSGFKLSESSLARARAYVGNRDKDKNTGAYNAEPTGEQSSYELDLTPYKTYHQPYGAAGGTGKQLTKAYSEHRLQQEAYDIYAEYGGKSYSEIQKAIAQNTGDDYMTQYRNQVLTQIGQQNRTREDIEREIAENEAELEIAQAEWERIANDVTTIYGSGNADEYNAATERVNALTGRKEALEGELWMWDQGEIYSAVPGYSDYKKNSAINPENGEWDDPVYRYINNIQRDGTVASENRMAAYEYMTPEEVGIYNYLYNVSGREAAEKYLEYLDFSLNNKRQREVFENAYDFADKNFGTKIAASLASIPANLLSGAGYLDVLGQRIQRVLTGSDKPIDYNRNAQSAYNFAQGAREGAMSGMSDTGKFIYSTVMSMGDSLGVLGISLLTGGSGATMLLGGSAATSTMHEAKANGASDGQALAMGFIAGAAETIMEKLPLEKLLNITPASNWVEFIQNSIKQGANEATEEVLTTLVNTAADVLIMGDKNALMRSYEKYLAQGYTPEEAERLAKNEWWLGLAGDAFAGFLSGGMFGAGGTAVKGINQYSDRTERGKGISASEHTLPLLIDHVEKGYTNKDTKEPLQYSEETKKTAEKIKSDLAAGKTVSNAQKGKLAEQILKDNAEFNEKVLPGILLEAQNREDAAVGQKDEMSSKKNEMSSKEAVPKRNVVQTIRDRLQKRADAKAGANNVDPAAAKILAQEVLNDESTYSKKTRAAAERIINGETVNNADSQALVKGIKADNTDFSGYTAEEIIAEASVLAQEEAPQSTGTETTAEIKTAVPQSTAQQTTTEGAMTNDQGTDGTGNEQRSTEGGTTYSDRGRGRFSEAYSGDAAPVSAQNRNVGAAKSRAQTASERQNKVADLRIEPTSAASVGINGGSEDATMYIIPEEAYDEELKSIAEDAKANGVTVHFFTGVMPVNNSYANASVSGDEMYVRADSAKYTAAELYDHEKFHKIFRGKPGLITELYNWIRNNYTAESFDDIIDTYYDKYNDVYGLDEMSADEALRIVLEEIFADAYAGTNKFAAGATEYTAPTRAAADAMGATSSEYNTNQGRAPPQGMTYDDVKQAVREVMSEVMGIEGNENTAEDGGEAKYSIKNTKDMSLKEQLSNYYKNKLKLSDSFYFGETPSILKESGLDEAPLALSQDDFKKSTKVKHDIPRRVINNLRDNLSKPLFTFTAGKQVAIMIDDIDGLGKPVVVAIHGGHNMDRRPVNLIKSIYGIDSVSDWVKTQIDGGSRFKVYDINKTNEILQTHGYLAEVGDSSVGSWDKITKTDSNVKQKFAISDEVDADGFYSHMARVVDGVKQEKLGASSVVNMLRGKGVKAEEIKWSGIEQFLEGKKSVTKAELQEFIAGSMLQIKETTIDSVEEPMSAKDKKKMAAFEKERDALVQKTKSEWRRIFGTSVLDDYVGEALPYDFITKLAEAVVAKKSATPIGQEYRAAQQAAKEMVEESYDYYGFDNARQAYVSMLRDPDSFLRGFELSASEESVVRRLSDAKARWLELDDAVPAEDVQTLKDLSGDIDSLNAEITDIRIKHSSEQKRPRWGSYKLKGGENYREIVFRMPNSNYSNDAMETHWGGFGFNGVLAHARIQDLDTPDGKMLFIEEIQSDWHNEGHKEGYAEKPSKVITTGNTTVKLENGRYELYYQNNPLGESVSASFLARRFPNGISDAEIHEGLVENYSQHAEYDSRVPDAPFRDSYHEFVLKRLIRKAAENGYDSIGWTTAQTQSDRWSKEYAEAYRIEYDQDIPKFLNKYGKKWGAKVKKTIIQDHSTHGFAVDGKRYSSFADALDAVVREANDLLGYSEDDSIKVSDVTTSEETPTKTVVYDNIGVVLGTIETIAGTEIWSMDITDSMRESVMTEGQPLYSLSDEYDVAPEDRTWEDTGDRKFNSYAFDHPELRPYFKEAARAMFYDLLNSAKGERWSTTSDSKNWTGSKRNTTENIARLLDNGHMTYKRIQEALLTMLDKAEDGKAMNRADVKKVELELDAMLQEGYTDPTGLEVEPNREYRRLLDAIKSGYGSVEEADAAYEAEVRDEAYEAQVEADVWEGYDQRADEMYDDVYSAYEPDVEAYEDISQEDRDYLGEIVESADELRLQRMADEKLRAAEELDEENEALRLRNMEYAEEANNYFDAYNYEELENERRRMDAVMQNALQNPDISAAPDTSAEHWESISAQLIEEKRRQKRENAVAEAENNDMYLPDGVSDAEILAAQEKYREQMAARKAADEAKYEGLTAEEAEAAKEADARRAQAEYLEGVDRKNFVGSDAMEKLKIKISRSIANYKSSAGLIERAKANAALVREMDKAIQKMHPSEEEKYFATGIMNNDLSEYSIPMHLDAERVLELADYMVARKAGRTDLFAAQKADINNRNRQLASDKFKNAEKAKRVSLTRLNYMTPRRAMIEMFGQEQGEEIYRTFFAPVRTNDAERIRFAERLRQEALEIVGADGKKGKLTKEERALTQMLMEGKAAGEMLAKMETGGKERIEAAAKRILKGEPLREENGKYVVGEESADELSAKEAEIARRHAAYTQAQEAIRTGTFDKKKVDGTRITNAAKHFAQQYDMLYEAINEFLVAHGEEPIGFIKGYAPHLQAEDAMKPLERLLGWMGAPTDITDLRAEIAGETHNRKPNRKWNPHFLSRTVGSETEYDVYKGFEEYVDYISEVFYHMDDIMRLRAASRYLRTAYTTEDSKNQLRQIEEVRNGGYYEKMNFLLANNRIARGETLIGAEIDEALDKYIDEILNEEENKTAVSSSLVMWLDNYTNLLAGKQNAMDRGLEQQIGRKGIRAVNKAVNRLISAQVVGNISSALNQMAQMPMTITELGADNVSKALWDLVRHSGEMRRWSTENDFLTARKGTTILNYQISDKLTKSLAYPLEQADWLMSSITARAAYHQALKQGMDVENAMQYSVQKSEDIMGSRNKASKPVAFSTKNPIMRLVNAYQIEVLNQWQHVIKDLPREYKSIAQSRGKWAAAGRIVKDLVLYLILAALINRIAEGTYGGTPAPLDLLGIVGNFAASGNGLTLNEGIVRVINSMTGKMFGKEWLKENHTFDSEMPDEFDWGAAWEDTAYTLSSEIPFLNNIMAVAGLTDDETVFAAGINDAKESFFGKKGEGGAIDHFFVTRREREEGEQESVEVLDGLYDVAMGISEFLMGGRQLQKTIQGVTTVAGRGEKNSSGNLMYPVADTVGNWIKSTLFGKTALENSRAYYASGASPLNSTRNEQYYGMVERGVDEDTAYAIAQGLADVPADKDENGETVSNSMFYNKLEYVNGLDIPEEAKDYLISTVYADLDEDSAMQETYYGLTDFGISEEKASEISSGLYAVSADKDEDGNTISGSKFMKQMDYVMNADIPDDVKDYLALSIASDAAYERYEAYELDKEGVDPAAFMLGWAFYQSATGKDKIGQTESFLKQQGVGAGDIAKIIAALKKKK